jgi:lysophospholipase L1-like esterase
VVDGRFPDNLHPSIQAYKKVAPIMAQAIANEIYGLVP